MIEPEIAFADAAGALAASRGAFTPSTRLVFIRRGRGWFVFRF